MADHTYSMFNTLRKLPLAVSTVKSYGNGPNENRVAFFSKTSTPAVVVMYFAGGVMPLGLTAKAGVIYPLNPDAATWKYAILFVNRGVMFVPVDAPLRFVASKSFHPDNRITSGRLECLKEAIADIRSSYPNSKLVGIGNSHGILEAVNLVKLNLLDKAVMMSGVWNADITEVDELAHVYVSNFGKKDATVPVLVVHHEMDQSGRCSYIEARKVMQEFEGITVTGGIGHQSLPREWGPGPHFYLTQENEVIRNIVLWLEDKPYSNYID